MTSFRQCLDFIKGDFFERSRRYSFLLTLGFALYAGYTFLPANHSNYVTLQIGGHRGIYNSAWIGALAAMHSALFLSIAGFYLVKNSIARDRQTGVGQILAATRMSKVSYLTMKALSNFLVLGSMVIVIIIAAAGMQLLRAEDAHINPWQLISPFVLITLPVLAIVSALAVLFESVRWLRGGLGNVVFFFLWMFGVSSEALEVDAAMGTNIVISQMKTATHEAFPDYNPDSGAVSMGYNIAGEGETMDLTTFKWSGIRWTAGSVAMRVMLYGIAAGLILFSTYFFDRFDAQPALPASGKRWRRKRRDSTDTIEKEGIISVQETNEMHPHLSRLASLPQASRFGQMLIAEIKLMFKGVSRWWMIIALGMVITGLSVPLEASREFLLPFAWVWPILLWSKMGTREARFRTDQILFSSPKPLWRQFPAVWLAGVLLAMLTGSGVAIRLMIAGDFYGVFAWLVGAMFIPTMALTFGVWSGSGKMFEVLYLLLWYAGPMNKVPLLDYMGSSAKALAEDTPIVFLVVIIILLTLALAGRKRQLTI